MFVQITAQTNTNPEVSNVTFSISGTTVTVTYDVSDAEQNSVMINMYVSSDGGTTWDYNYGSTNGDIGYGISTGTGKTITWIYSDEYAENFKIKIIANDLIEGGSPCADATVEYGGKTYNTIQIGNQCWLKENLDIGAMILGTEEQTIGDKYCFGDDAANCDIYGGLYQWQVAQNICPPGWHLPSWAEFTLLTNLVSSSGNALKAVGAGTDAGAGTNTSGFSALLAGYRYIYGIFFYLNNYGYFWSSTEKDEIYSYYIQLHTGNNKIYPRNANKDFGYSVRCIKD